MHGSFEIIGNFEGEICQRTCEYILGSKN